MSATDVLLNLVPDLTDSMVNGNGYVLVRCPYHGGGRERTPSLSISTWKPVYFCHGCGASGHISALFQTFGLGRDLVQTLVPPSDYQPKQKSTLAAKIFRNADPFRGEFVLDERLLDAYRLAPMELIKAGFTQKTLLHFEIGFDYANKRITFPLRNVFGELVGVSGRTVIRDCEPRYKIYDTEFKERSDYTVPAAYSMEAVKSSVLWHAHVTRPLFFEDCEHDTIIVTEGFKAAMWLWQSGYHDVVALVGSYLTPAHAELLARAAHRVVLCLDNNEAGHKGTAKAGRALLSKGCEVCVARYPDHRQQPDDLTAEEVHELIDKPESFRSWNAKHPFAEPLKKLIREFRCMRP